jgi:hypothetical protein
MLTEEEKAAAKQATFFADDWGIEEEGTQRL